MEKKDSLELTRLSPDEEVESAKILFREGLIEEAKKLLFQILILIPHHLRARALLEQIQEKEEVQLLARTIPEQKSREVLERPSEIIDRLNTDLGLDLHLEGFDPQTENWRSTGELNARERYDLGVAFFEMGCFKDALRELKIAERTIRLQQTFLGELGVCVTGLIAESLVESDLSYEAKAYLEPILSEPDLKLEQKIIYFYVMGRCEEALGRAELAKGWYRQTLEVDPHFRDAQFRLTRIR